LIAKIFEKTSHMKITQLVLGNYESVLFLQQQFAVIATWLIQSCQAVHFHLWHFSNISTTKTT